MKIITGFVSNCSTIVFYIEGSHQKILDELEKLGITEIDGKLSGTDLYIGDSDIRGDGLNDADFPVMEVIENHFKGWWQGYDGGSIVYYENWQEDK